MSYGDNPIESKRQDKLKRAPVARALKDFVSGPELDTPMSVGIYGEWGSGKTSVMKMLAEQLIDAPKVQFDAWKFGTDADALWRALVTQVASALKDKEDDTEVDDLLENLYRSRSTVQSGELQINWRAAFPLAIQAAISFLPGGENIKNLTSWFRDKDNFKQTFELFEREERERFHAQIQSLEQFQARLDDLLHSRVVVPDRRLYVFVDDLDRCLASAAVSILEAIKVFFRAPGCVFILGLDRRIVEAGVKERHPTMSKSDAAEYLDKIVQVPFHLPPLDETQMRNFIQKWCEDHDENALKNDAGLISIGVAPNPRKVKRTLNVLSLARSLRESVGMETDDALQRALTKIVVIQNSYEDVYRQLVEKPPYLASLETAAQKGEANEALERYPRLAEMLRLDWSFTDRTHEELTDLLFLTRFGHTSTS